MMICSPRMPPPPSLASIEVFPLIVLSWMSPLVPLSVSAIPPPPPAVNTTASTIFVRMTGSFSFAPAGFEIRELGFTEISGPTFASQAVLVSACQRALEVLIEICSWLASVGVEDRAGEAK